MQKVIWISIAILALFVSIAFCESQPIKGEVRSSTGKLLYKTRTDGNKTEVRNPSGKLLYKSRTAADGRTEVRSPSGKLLYKTK